MQIFQSGDPTCVSLSKNTQLTFFGQQTVEEIDREKQCLGLVCDSMQKFSKVRSLLNLLCTMTIELALEKFDREKECPGLECDLM